MKLGIDMENCARMAGIVNEKIFSPAEIAYIQQKNHALPTIAGLYCAKEAYFKAQGTGIIKSQLPKVEIAHDAAGKPYYAHDPQALLSISHTSDQAVAICLII